MAALESYAWPGNLRELRNVIERAVILAGPGPLTVEEILIPERAIAPLSREAELADSPGPRTLLENEEQMIREALARAGGNKSKAARLLGITRRALYGRLEKYGIEPEA
jgi:DNA-binding NtrC family response regulator